ncbi:MAG: helix-hairpin-helix domain-containing protein [Eggerthellaceae bacterium]|nr:helix-hairpin-helix domain-containing protein [Eggerthellaceae bacterium]
MEDITALQGVRERDVKYIVADREANGAFKSKEDLKRVIGISYKKYESLLVLICVCLLCIKQSCRSCCSHGEGQPFAGVFSCASLLAAAANLILI